MILIDKSSPVPLYRQIRDGFRRLIVDGSLSVGDCLPSIRELQRTLGVAPETVKRAMAELDDAGLIDRVHGKGAFVAEPRADQPFWGLVVPFYSDFYNKVVVELRRVAEGRGVEVEHACDYDDWPKQQAAVEDYVARGAEAVVVVPTRDERDSLEWRQRVSRRTPLLLFDHTSIASQLPYVIQDYVRGVRLGMEAMASSGARRIAFARDPLWPAGNPIHRAMEEAYNQACEELTDGYRRFFPSPGALDDAQARRPDFDGLFCADDLIACLMIGRLTEGGLRVPDDVQVIGCNDSDHGRFFTPRVTTVAPDLSAMCRRVAEIIQRHSEGRPVETRQYVSLPRLIQRESSL